MLSIKHSVVEKYPNLHFGLMVVSNVFNPKISVRLDSEKTILEELLVEKFGALDRKELRTMENLGAYYQFYKRFKKTYHVELQLISVAHKGKKIPQVASLVEAMFMAELSSQILTAGYDYDFLKPNFEVSLANGDQAFCGIGKKEKNLSREDVVFSDSSEILGSIICGPSHWGRITGQTTRAMFVVYGVPGIGENEIVNHLRQIFEYVKLISNSAVLEHMEVR